LAEFILADIFVRLLAATVIYLIGVFGLTVFGNVPLNNTLDRFKFRIGFGKGNSFAKSEF
jgi:hypothetical protein